MKNVFTRLGRPPKGAMPYAGKLSSGERQGNSPMAKLDTAIPGSAFRGGGKVNGCAPMPSYHDDPAMRKGGPTRRR